MGSGDGAGLGKAAGDAVGCVAAADRAVGAGTISMGCVGAGKGVVGAGMGCAVGEGTGSAVGAGTSSEGASETEGGDEADGAGDAVGAGETDGTGVVSRTECEGGFGSEVIAIVITATTIVAKIMAQYRCTTLPNEGPELSGFDGRVARPSPSREMSMASASSKLFESPRSRREDISSAPTSRREDIMAACAAGDKRCSQPRTTMKRACKL